MFVQTLHVNEVIGHHSSRVSTTERFDLSKMMDESAEIFEWFRQIFSKEGSDFKKRMESNEFFDDFHVRYLCMRCSTSSD